MKLYIDYQELNITVDKYLYCIRINNFTYTSVYMALVKQYPNIGTQL